MRVVRADPRGQTRSDLQFRDAKTNKTIDSRVQSRFDHSRTNTRFRDHRLAPTSHPAIAISNIALHLPIDGSRFLVRAEIAAEREQVELREALFEIRDARTDRPAISRIAR